MLAKAKLGGLLLALLALALAPGGSSAPATASATISLPGLELPVRVIRDGFGVPHVYAETDHDVWFANGYLHAQDRFFQMDLLRRQAGGTLASLLGSGALPTDVALRTIGLRRAAERSAAEYPASLTDALQAYADGVNTWLDSNPLPLEYGPGALELSSVPDWTVIDSIAIIKLIPFALSFDGNEPQRTVQLLTYQAVGAAVGFNGTALFFQDVMRSAPFDPTISIGPGEESGDVSFRPGKSHGRLETEPLAAAAALLEGAETGILAGEAGSNWWLISGEKSSTGYPMLASDPHLSLSSPPVWHELHLNVSGGSAERMNVYGTSFAGVPGIVLGQNESIAWGATVNPLDVTDFFQEVTSFVGGVPVATFHDGAWVPLTFIPAAYEQNNPANGTFDDVTPVAPSASVPPFVFEIPYRNFGTIVGVSPATGTSISFQYTGLDATRELETFLTWQRADTLAEFKDALRFFDFGSQNWSYVDVEGNVAYFTGAEMPLREDLQLGFVAGPGPAFVRDGTGAFPHEWIADPTPAADQANPYELLPAGEFPRLVNPAKGYIANANNDPVGTTLDNNPFNQLRPGGAGILYFAPGYADGNRIARVDARIQAELTGDGTVSPADMASIQADVVLNDADALAPAIPAAFDSGAPALAPFVADPAVAEAAGRIEAWDRSTPTGIPEGYDAADVNGVLGIPSAAEQEASVAATIYALWRSRMLENVIDATLLAVGIPASALPSDDRALIAVRHLLVDDADGIGASGLDFFPGPGATAAEQKHFTVLQSLQQALGDAALIFGTPSQADWKWGNLHRVVFAHPLGGPFSIPAAGPGFATDGGYEVVDASSHDARADAAGEFTFGSGPSRRFIGEAQPSGIVATQVIPGGESGNPFSPFFGNQLPLWLTNEAHAALDTRAEVAQDTASQTLFVPGG